MYSTENILEYIKKYTDNRYLEISDIIITESSNKSSSNLYSVIIKSAPTTWRPDATEKTFAKIKLSKSMQYIAFNENCSNIFSELSIPYSKIKSEKMLRIMLDDFFAIDTFKLKKLFNQVFVNAFSITSFGCCGKFHECEKKCECVHTDVIYANACQYRKIIENKQIHQ